MRKLIFVALLIAAPLVQACNTVDGVGKDLHKAGDHVEDRAQQTGGTEDSKKN